MVYVYQSVYQSIPVRFLIVINIDFYGYVRWEEYTSAQLAQQAAHEHESKLKKTTEPTTGVFSVCFQPPCNVERCLPATRSSDTQAPSLRISLTHLESARGVIQIATDSKIKRVVDPSSIGTPAVAGNFYVMVLAEGCNGASWLSLAGLHTDVLLRQ